MQSEKHRERVRERIRLLGKHRKKYLRLEWFGEGYGVHSCKRPTNKAEAFFYDQMVKAGWVVMRSGWPDFICFRGHEIHMVEVKPKKSVSMRGNQLIVMNALAHQGFTCYRWDLEKGFMRIQEQSCMFGESE